MLVHAHGYTEGAKGGSVYLATLETRYLDAVASHVLAYALRETEQGFGVHDSGAFFVGNGDGNLADQAALDGEALETRRLWLGER